MAWTVLAAGFTCLLDSPGSLLEARSPNKTSRSKSSLDKQSLYSRESLSRRFLKAHLVLISLLFRSPGYDDREI